MGTVVQWRLCPNFALRGKRLHDGIAATGPATAQVSGYGLLATRAMGNPRDLGGWLKWDVPQLYMWIFHVYSIAMFAKAMENDDTLPWPRPPIGAAEKILNLQLQPFHELIDHFQLLQTYSPVNCGSSYVRSHQSRTTSHETGWCWQMTCKGHTTWNCLGRFVGLSWSTSQVVVFHVGVLLTSSWDPWPGKQQETQRVSKK